MARRWCEGHIIDGSPALGHAIKVALTLQRHAPGTSRETLAAVLLHDAPDYAPDVDQVVTRHCGPDVTKGIRLLAAEHALMGIHDHDPHAIVDHVRYLAETRPEVLNATAADKVVSIDYVLTRSRRADDAAAYWDTRPAFLRLLPYFDAFTTAATPHLPRTLGTALRLLLAGAPLTATSARAGAGNPASTPGTAT